MAKVHIGNLVEVRNWIVPKNDPYDKGTWQTEYRFQNVNTTANISYSGGNYKFLSFIYNGATRTRTGDNIEASLLVTTNQIAMDIAYDIVQKADHSKKQIVVRTCLMNDNFTGVQKCSQKNAGSERLWATTRTSSKSSSPARSMPSLPASPTCISTKRK